MARKEIHKSHKSTLRDSNDTTVAALLNAIRDNPKATADTIIKTATPPVPEDAPLPSWVRLLQSQEGTDSIERSMSTTLWSLPQTPTWDVSQGGFSFSIIGINAEAENPTKNRLAERLRVHPDDINQRLRREKTFVFVVGQKDADIISVFNKEISSLKRYLERNGKKK